MPDDTTDNGWREWKNTVLASLKRIEAQQQVNCSRIEELKLELTVLKVKWGVIISIAAVVGSAIVTVVARLLSS